MKTRSHLQTVRFQPEEVRQVERYLKQNLVFESFSALARVATLTFVRQENMLRLLPVEGRGTPTPRPRFLWDYEMGETQVREILNRPGLTPTKQWLIERILTQARFDEVLAYLDLTQIRKILPKLRLPEKIRQRWKYALGRWAKEA